MKCVIRLWILRDQFCPTNKVQFTYNAEFFINEMQGNKEIFIVISLCETLRSGEVTKLIFAYLSLMSQF